MVAVAEKKKPGRKKQIEQSKVSKRKNKQEEIPAYLVYETLDDIPVYYRGYKEVLDKTKTFEEIMAYGELQALLLTLIKDYLQPFFGKQYWLLQGEIGLHVSHGTNPSLDLSIYPKEVLSLKKAPNKYISIPPKVVIEVDTKADVLTFESQEKGNYYLLKTQKLLDFGVEEVVWFFTNINKVTVARPNQPWLTVDWKDEIEVMGHKFSIQQVIEESEKE
jgi:Uma2 family endonuclease